MKEATRATVYFDKELHQALRMKAAESDTSISVLVNNAVKMSLSEDAEDLAAFEKRKRGKSVPFEDVLKRLKIRGKI